MQWSCSLHVRHTLQPHTRLEPNISPKSCSLLPGLRELFKNTAGHASALHKLALATRMPTFNDDSTYDSHSRSPVLYFLFCFQL